MEQNTQTRITDQICKVQTDKRLIAMYDRLRYAAFSSYAQLHAKGEYQENGRKIHSLIGITIQDYSNGTGNKNVIAQFNLAPEQVQFLLTRIMAGFQEFEWNQQKIFGEPDAQGFSIAQIFNISRHAVDNQGRVMNSPWRIQITNGKGVRMKNKNGGAYMKGGSFQALKSASIQLTDMDLFSLLKRVDSYITNWENCISASLINNGKQALAQQQMQNQTQNQPQPGQDTPYAA